MYDNLTALHNDISRRLEVSLKRAAAVAEMSLKFEVNYGSF